MQGCISYEVFTLGVICNEPWAVMLAAPGFVFRAIANLARLYAALTLDSSKAKKGT